MGFESLAKCQLLASPVVLHLADIGRRVESRTLIEAQAERGDDNGDERIERLLYAVACAAILIYSYAKLLALLKPFVPAPS